MVKLKIGVSSCLLGENVRHNGGNCNNHYIQTILSEYAEFIPSCPEVAIGMGIPRPAVRLEQGNSNETLMINPKNGDDYTLAMNEYSAKRAKKIRTENLDGYIFKKNSPSCGVFRVKLYVNGQPAERRNIGLFAKAIKETMPYLPLEEEGRLCDPALREHFLVRVFAYRRLKELFKNHWSRSDVIKFHSCEKSLLLAHSPKNYRELGQLVGNIAKYKDTEFKVLYTELFMACLSQKSTVGRNVNTLMHMAGYLKDGIEEDGRKELNTAINDYQCGLIPLIVPITLLRHMLHRVDETYLLKQSYLQPHPKELMLRNYIQA